MFWDESLNLLKYIAEECKRQHSGEMSVYWLADAWAKNAIAIIKKGKNATG